MTSAKDFLNTHELPLLSAPQTPRENALYLDEYFHKLKNIESAHRAEDVVILRRLLRKAEITKKLCHVYDQGFRALDPTPLTSAYIDDFLAHILDLYENTKDLKLLNGFLKVGSGELLTPSYQAPEALKELAESYLESV